MSRDYKTAPGRSWSKARVAEIGKALEAIGEVITPASVVEAARDPKSTLHCEFDWKDSVAAEKWRLAQARGIINHVHLNIQIKKSKVTTRAYVNVEVADSSDDADDGSPRAYYSLSEVKRDARLMAQHKANLLRELEGLKRRYSQWADIIANCIRRIR